MISITIKNTNQIRRATQLLYDLQKLNLGPVFVDGSIDAQLMFAISLSGALVGSASKNSTIVNPLADLYWYPQIPLHLLPTLKPVDIKKPNVKDD